MDIYSRKIVGWEVYVNESAEQAADVLREARFAETLHGSAAIDYTRLLCAF